jgi:GT2 family glycosyltransferase
MISLVVPYLEIDEEKPALLKRFLDSVVGQYDELIISDSKTDSYTKKVNDGLKKATGDYLIVGSDDIYLARGSLRDLPKDWVTYPFINDQPKSFGVLFCLPRAVYEQIGGLDERYNIYCSDNDYLMMLSSAQIKWEAINTVNFHHPVGGRTVKKIENIHDKAKKDEQIYFEKWGERQRDL